MRIGDKVICINDSFHPLQLESIPNRPVKDRTYTIRDIRYYDEIDKTGVALEEVVNPLTVVRLLFGRSEPTFNINRFSPIQKKSVEKVQEVMEEVECL